MIVTKLLCLLLELDSNSALNLFKIVKNIKSKHLAFKRKNIKSSAGHKNFNTLLSLGFRLDTYDLRLLVLSTFQFEKYQTLVLSVFQFELQLRV